MGSLGQQIKLHRFLPRGKRWGLIGLLQILLDGVQGVEGVVNSPQEAVTDPTKQAADFPGFMTVVHDQAFFVGPMTDGTDASLGRKHEIVLLRGKAELGFQVVNLLTGQPFLPIFGVVCLATGLQLVDVAPVVVAFVCQILFSVFLVPDFTFGRQDFFPAFSVPTFVVRHTGFTRRLADAFGLDLPTELGFVLVLVAFYTNHNGLSPPSLGFFS